MKYLLIFFVALTIRPAIAQNYIDLANVYWRTSPANEIENSTNKRHLNMFVADFKLPIVVNDNNVIITGVEYQQNSIQTTEPTFIEKYKFASTTLQLGLQHDWNDRSKMLFMVIPRFNTDYNDVSMSHFQIGGLALGTTSRSENFDWKYGLYYNGEFFGNMFVPLFGFNWKINEKWRFKTIIPINLEISYQPKDWFVGGLRFDGVNGSYRARLFPNSVFNPNYHIDKSDNNVWLFTAFHLGKNVWFHLKGGHSVLRKYRFYDNNEKLALKLGPVNIGDDRPESIPLFENGFSFELRFIYRLPLD